MDKLVKQYAEIAIRHVKEGLYLDEVQKETKVCRAQLVFVLRCQIPTTISKVVFEKGVTPVVCNTFMRLNGENVECCHVEKLYPLKVRETVNVWNEDMKRLRYKLKQ